MPVRESETLEQCFWYTSINLLPCLMLCGIAVKFTYVLFKALWFAVPFVFVFARDAAATSRRAGIVWEEGRDEYALELDTDNDEDEEQMPEVNKGEQESEAAPNP